MSNLTTFLYIDVSLPVPLDRPFTYALPDTLQHRAQPGCRVVVPFGPRKLTGVILRAHNNIPEIDTRLALKLLDEEPAFSPALLDLAKWVASYYCAPLGEVLRIMAPLSHEVRHSRTWTLTSPGRDIVRRLLTGDSSDDPAVNLLRALEQRPLAESTIERKFPSQARKLLQSLAKKQLIESEQTLSERDPLRAPAARLRVEFSGRPAGIKLTKPERELAAFLELHPGPHNLEVRRSPGQRRRHCRPLPRPPPAPLPHARAPHHRRLLGPPPVTISTPPSSPPSQPSPRHLDSHTYQTFLLHGVTGSGKTEVYLNAIEAALARDRGALLLVPEIALTPAVAGQFHARFGDLVAILHSAFNDTERAEQWRRLRRGDARVVVGTRSAVFAPVPDLGLIIVDEEHDGSYKQEENPRYNGRDVAIVRARDADAVVVLGSATPSLETRYNVERGKSILLELPERIENRPMPSVEIIDMRQEFLETRQQRPVLPPHDRSPRRAPRAGEQTIVLMNRRGFSASVACRSCGERVQCVQLRRRPHLPPPRQPPALPLLQLRPARPPDLPQVQQRTHLLPRRRQRDGRG